MKNFNENKLLFYSAVQKHDDYINPMFVEILLKDFDWFYFIGKAKYLGVASGFLKRIKDSEIKLKPNIENILKKTAEQELYKSASMLSLYNDVSSILHKNRIEFIPLKGADKRIKRGEFNFSNMMTDIDILVRIGDVEKTADVLIDNGYKYQGCFSGAHINFYTNEDPPRFIEVHWDLINRASSIQKLIFDTSMDNIWKRCIRDDQECYLSWEDLLMYLTAHCIKEYFHKPKWLADIVWILDEMAEVTDIEMNHLKEICDEWKTGNALLLISSALDYYIKSNYCKFLNTLFTKKPGFLINYTSKRVIDYDELISIRGFIYSASSGSFKDILKISFNYFLKNKCQT